MKTTRPGRRPPGSRGPQSPDRGGGAGSKKSALILSLNRFQVVEP